MYYINLLLIYISIFAARYQVDKWRHTLWVSQKFIGLFQIGAISTIPTAKI